jgi:hypothetical protein
MILIGLWLLIRNQKAFKKLKKILKYVKYQKVSAKISSSQKVGMLDQPDYSSVTLKSREPTRCSISVYHLNG